jgi:hypothetical protein
MSVMDTLHSEDVRSFIVHEDLFVNGFSGKAL